MLLTVTTTARPATDLGYLLHKHPGRLHEAALPVGTAHVFYPEATEERCTAALLLEVDPIGLVRRGGGATADGFALGQYVNDRPYAASSLLAVALGKVFSTARRGVSKERPELAERPLPLEVHVPVLACSGGAEGARRFFTPLGWQVEATPLVLDPAFPAWGSSRYVELTLRGELTVAAALNHLYVALPVLDDAKHYWVDEAEIDKLLRAGQGWLADHPDRELITRRYLAHRGGLTREALARLAEVDDVAPEVLDDALAPAVDAVPITESSATQGITGGGGDGETPLPLAVQRHRAVLEVLHRAGAHRVLDLGCGDGALLRALLAERWPTEVVGVDVSHRALAVAARRLRLEDLPERQRGRVRLLQGALTYTDDRLVGFDAAVLMEVVEHVDAERLPALEHAVFGHARPGVVVVTTPNREVNVRFTALLSNGLRHRDHRFEWTRAEFAGWAESVGQRYGYEVELGGVGAEDDVLGQPTQLAVLTRIDSAATSEATRAEVVS